MEVDIVSKKMKDDWNTRADTNIRKYIDLKNWKTKEEFRNSGLVDARKVIQNIKVDGRWNVLEIGIGIGRVASHLSGSFQYIYGVDVSSSTIEAAREELREFHNIKILQNNGIDLSIFSKNDIFDFIYSVKVFQHMPKEIFLSYLDEIRRLLKLGGLLRFQMFENTKLLGVVPWIYLRNLRNFHLKFWQEPPEDDTWIARVYPKKELENFLSSRGFEVLSVETDHSSNYEGDLWVTARLMNKK